jgi:HEAT repeat protein
VQKEAATALARLHASAATSHLIGLLAAGFPDVRRAAAAALGDIGAQEALPALRALVDDPDVEVRKAVERAVQTITTP